MIEQLGARALAIRRDVIRVEGIRTALRKTIEAFGRLDFAFNNAGLKHAINPAADVTAEAQYALQSFRR